MENKEKSNVRVSLEETIKASALGFLGGCVVGLGDALINPSYPTTSSYMSVPICVVAGIPADKSRIQDYFLGGSAATVSYLLGYNCTRLVCQIIK